MGMVAAMKPIGVVPTASPNKISNR